MSNLPFRQKLVDICSDIGTDDLVKLKFLLKDVTGQAKLEAANFALDLFSILESKRHVNLNDGRYLAECFCLIGRLDLVRQLELDPSDIEDEMQHSPKLLPFRIMLYQISEDIGEKEFKQLKFYCTNTFDLKRKQVERIKTIFDLFVILEQGTHLNPPRTHELREMMKSLERGDLIELIDEYQGRYPTMIDGSDDDTGINGGTQPLDSAVPDVNPSLNSRLQSPSANPIPGADRHPDIKTYDMDAHPRGYCIIINNNTFAGVVFENPLRRGSDTDAANLQQTFHKLGFLVEQRTNLRVDDIQSLMLEVSQRDHRKFNALVVCILSHGSEHQVYGVDEIQIPIRYLTANFRSSNCRSLAGKPKLFFIQACQGHTKQRGLQNDIEADGPTVMERPFDLQQDANDVAPQIDKVIPDESDFLIGYSTVTGYYSYRDPSRGSIYIQKLTKNLEKHANSLDLLQILTIVNQDVSEENIPDKTERGKINKQVPMPQYTLSKALYFNTHNLPPLMNTQPSDRPN